jgi:nitroreductase
MGGAGNPFEIALQRDEAIAILAAMTLMLAARGMGFGSL